jgi:O-acetyl-ADP-ribose deacetylase (regulator of RNase III)
MPATFTEGDLFADSGIRAWGHGCNCAGAMGAGIAVEFKRRFPRMFDEYRVRCADGRFALGDVFVWNEGDVTVYNLGTQEHWRKKAQLAALSKAVTRMVSLAEKGGIERVALPRIGAGLGGLDWPKVRAVLKEAGDASQVELVVFERYVPAGS